MHRSLLFAKLGALSANRPVRRARHRPQRGRVLRVVAFGNGTTTGTLLVGDTVIPCVLGRTGSKRLKREGDGATPTGIWRLDAVLYRPDRGRPRTGIPALAVRENDGWCDDPASRRYNQAVSLPLAASHERLWRDDRLYDRIVVLSHNRHPVRRDHGSAVFLHIAQEDRSPTAGCVAFSEMHLNRVLFRVNSGCRIDIAATAWIPLRR